ncbi:mediterrocin family bacteriocin, partial [Clostridium bowmanii]|uniref:mediterrocin family bacteriocin n=1 Tax=Clostridium bowmanii TaxID=132925 RepID=UPI001C0E09F9
TWKVNNGPHTFAASWEANAGSPSSFGFIYGYNTDWFNEDYVYGMCSTSHYSAISNGNGPHSSAMVAGNSWANLEVLHSGTGIYYGIVY